MIKKITKLTEVRPGDPCSGYNRETFYYILGILIYKFTLSHN